MPRSLALLKNRLNYAFISIIHTKYVEPIFQRVWQISRLIMALEAALQPTSSEECGNIWLSIDITGPANGADNPRTIFIRALEACDLKWSDPHLQSVLNNDYYRCVPGGHWDNSQKQGEFDAEGSPLWSGMLHSNSRVGI